MPVVFDFSLAPGYFGWGLINNRQNCRAGLHKSSHFLSVRSRLAFFLLKDLLHMPSIISVSHLSKTYGSGFQALKDINLEIEQGEIFALLGPNGAGKTTLISIICGINNLSGGRVTVGGHDIISDSRAARTMIGLVPQELHTDAFEIRMGHGELQPRPVRQA